MDKKAFKIKYVVIALLFGVMCLMGVGVSKWNIHIQHTFDPFAYYTEDSSTLAPIIADYLHLTATTDGNTTTTAADYDGENAAFTYSANTTYGVQVEGEPLSSTNSATCTWTEVGIEFTYIYVTKGTTTALEAAPTNAGSYTCYVIAAAKATASNATAATTAAANINIYSGTTATGSKNYAAKVNFTVQKATYDMSGISFDSATYTYDGTEKTITISGTLPDGVTVAYTDNAQTDAGEYTATATFTGDTTNYNAINPLTATLTINKATIAAPTEGTTEYTYTGSSITYTPSGFDSATMTISGNTQTDTGTYTATVTPKANYMWSDGTTAAKTFTWTIVASVTVTIPAADEATYTYTGSAQTYKLATSDYYTISGNTQTIAGTYTVTVTLNDSSYKWSDGTTAAKTYTFTINKAAAVITVSDFPEDKTYDGAALTFPSATSTFGTPTMTVSYTATDSDTATTPDTYENAGAYTVTYTVEATDNYDGATVTKTVTISQAKLSLKWTDQSKTYNGKQQTPTVTISSGKITDDDVDVTATVASGDGINAGTYTATATLSGKACGNYTISNSTASYKINKATLKLVATSLIEADYDSSRRSFDAVFNYSSNDVTAVGWNTLYGSDALTLGTDYKITKAYDGANKYTSTTTYVIGTTYQVTIELLETTTANNYTLLTSDNTCCFKYKTAKIDSTYYTIEDALNTASSGNTILLCGDSTTTNKSYVTTAFTGLEFYSGTAYYTIKSGVTLHVPYEDSTTAVTDSTSGTSYVYSVLNIPSSVTLTNSGTLTVAAKIVGSMSTRTYERGVVMNGGTIDSTGTINAYGYIKGTGTLNVTSGTVTDVFTAYDFKGGSQTVGATYGSLLAAMGKNQNGVFPLNAYTVHNTSCKTVVNAGALLECRYSLYMSSTFVTGEVVIVGNSSTSGLFKLTSGTIVKTVEDDTVNTSVTGSNQSATQIDNIVVNGDCEDGTLSVKVEVSIISATISSGKDFPAPIGLMDITVGSSGNLKLTSNSYKIMPGRHITIDNGGSLTVGSGVTLYLYTLEQCKTDENYSVTNSSGTVTNTNSFYTKYCTTSTPDAYIEVNGTLTVNGYIGGKITTSGDGAVLNMNGSASATIRRITALDSSSSTNPSGTFEDDSTLTAQGYIYTSNDAPTELSNFTTGTYYSDGTAWYTMPTITYNPNGGSVTPTSVNASTVTLPAPTRTGYRFDGWWTLKDGGTKIGDGGEEVTYYVSVTLYAHWTAYYTVTFDPGSGTLTSGTTKTVYYGESYGTLPTPTAPDGYDFKGWFTAASGGTIVTSTTTVQLTADATLYAQYSGKAVTVTFNAGSGGTLTDNTKTVYYGSAYGELPTPTTVGNNVFDGWYTAETGGTQITAASIVGSGEAYSQTITLYAQYHEVAELITITLDYNYDSKTSTLQLEKDSTFALADADRTGYTFLGWYTTASGGTAVNGTTVSEETTVYAQWTANTYEIKYFDAGGGTFSGTHGSGYPTTHTYDTATTLVSPTRVGYTFNGWYTTQDCEDGTLVTALGATDYTDTINLYAQWKAITYTIKYSANGITVTTTLPANITNLQIGDTFTVDAATQAASGYRFMGYAATSDCINKSATYLSGEQTLTADLIANADSSNVITLYAAWYQWLKVSVTYSGDGSMSACTATVTNGYYNSANSGQGSSSSDAQDINTNKYIYVTYGSEVGISVTGSYKKTLITYTGTGSKTYNITADTTCTATGKYSWFSLSVTLS